MTAPTRPEPVLNWATVVANWQKVTAAVVGVVYAAGALLVALGLADDTAVNGWATATGAVLAGVGTLLAVILPLVGAQHTMAAAQAVREQVTPLEAPQNSDGHALVDAVEVYGEHAAKRLIVSDDLHEAN